MKFKILGILCLAVGVAACDPCAGLLACGDARVLSEGDVVWHYNRQAAEGTVVHFERTTGVSLDTETIVAIVEADGRFELRASASGPGNVHGRLVFFPPAPFESMAFAQEGVTLLATGAPDQPRFLGSWGVGPLQLSDRIRYFGELHHRGSGEPVSGATVEVERVGGIHIDPARFVTLTGPDGRFDIDIAALEPGVARVDIRVYPPDRADSVAATNVLLAPSGQPRLLARWTVGHHVFYSGELKWGDGAQAGEIEVEFRFTDPSDRAPIRSRTGGDGRFYLRPHSAGPVVFRGDLIVRPGTDREQVLVEDLSLVSFAADAPRLLGIWWIER